VSTLTPPTLPPDMPELPPEPPAWPTVVGTISIVFGCFGFCCLGLAALGPTFATMAMPESEVQRGLPPHIQITLGYIVLIAAGVLLSCILLAAGILTIKRQAAGRAVHIVYGVLGFVQAVGGFMFNLAREAAFRQWLVENPDSFWASPGASSGGAAGGIIGNIIGLIIGLAYPIFVLVWFLAVKRTHASMLGQPESTADTGR
jgi:hypothetical protein